MTGPSLQKHEKDLKTLESKLGEIQASAAISSTEATQQISSLASLIADMNKQFTNQLTQIMTDSAQARKDRDDLSGQLRTLAELVSTQAASSHPQTTGMLPSFSPVHTSILPTPHVSTPIQFGNRSTHNTPPIVHIQSTTHTQNVSKNQSLMFSNNTQQNIHTPSQGITISSPPVSNHTIPFMNPPLFNNLPPYPTSHTIGLNVPLNPTTTNLQYTTNPQILGWHSLHDTSLPKPVLQPHYKFPKMDFPRFDGKNARGWVSKADKFFMLNPSIDSYTKVIYAALYLDGEADFWYQTIQGESQRLPWEKFTELVLRRFSTGNEENLIGKFNKLVQTGTVDSYVGQFEELRGFMMAKYPYQSEDFYLSSFISGLRPDIQQALYIYKPTTLQEAVDKAKEQEIFVDMIEKK